MSAEQEFMPERLADDAVEAYCAWIPWLPDTDSDIKIATIGNIRRFAIWVRGEITIPETNS